MRKSRENNDIRNYILDNIEICPNKIVSITSQHFGLTRNTINKYLDRLIDEGLVEYKGNTKARHYKLKNLVDKDFLVRLTAHTSEDDSWRNDIMPLIKGMRQNVVNLCQYCYTEILNNAIDHSASFYAYIKYRQNCHQIIIDILDEGVGIFEKIKNDFRLPDPRTALLELSKGKITSDKKNHAGQGIFFSSRMVDEFIIVSGQLFYSRKQLEDDEWLIETEEKAFEKGTLVSFKINLDAERTTKEVFEKYQGSDLSFRKTHVPLKLGRYPGEELVSRSQAKRVLARFESFTEVMLDFSGVEIVGQAFADEIFRVFKNNHPDVKVFAINTTPQIDNMINLARLVDLENKQ